jgi:uncharacterized phage-like protein YoqJ
MPSRQTSACFTGHRYLQKYSASWIETELYSAILCSYLHGTKRFISGGAIGIDQLAAKLVLKLKQQYSDVVLTFAKPFEKQASVWPQHAVEAYDRLLEQADEIVNVCENPENKWQAVKSMQIRNEWMVNNSNLVIAVWDGNKGGTANCFAYAQKSDITILRLDPAKQQVEWVEPVDMELF